MAAARECFSERSKMYYDNKSEKVTVIRGESGGYKQRQPASNSRLMFVKDYTFTFTTVQSGFYPHPYNSESVTNTAGTRNCRMLKTSGACRLSHPKNSPESERRHMNTQTPNSKKYCYITESNHRGVRA
jgi:hypothetical protein